MRFGRKISRNAVERINEGGDIHGVNDVEKLVEFPVAGATTCRSQRVAEISVSCRHSQGRRVSRDSSEFFSFGLLRTLGLLPPFGLRV